MKTKLLITLLFIFISSSFSLTGQDVFLENIYVPTENSQASPHSIVYNDINNLFYIYTGQKIIFVNKTIGIIVGAITVGQTGYFIGFHSIIEKTHKLVFDHSRNYIYCANEDDKLLVIDCNNNQIIHEFSSLDPLIGSFLYYNPDLDRLYWAQNSVHIIGNTCLVGINLSSMSTFGPYDIASGHIIFDVTFCHQNDYLALSTSSKEGHNGYVSLLDPLDLSEFDSYNFGSYDATKLLYIDEANRLYCISQNNSNSCLDAFLINPYTNQLNYISNYSINDFPVFGSESSCYIGNNIHYAYFVGKTTTGDFKLVIVDYTRQNTNSPIVAELILPHVDQVLCSPSNDRVYCSGYNLYKIYGSDIENSVSVNGVSNHLIHAGDDQIVLSNLEANSIDSYSLSLELIHQVHLGDDILKGVLNPTWQKNYWIQDFSPESETFLSIQNLSDNSFTSIAIGRAIYDLAYHAGSEKLVVSNHDYMESQITVVDGHTDQFQVISTDQVNLFQPGENNYTYLGGWNVLEFMNMSDYTIGQIQNNGLTSPYEIRDFALLKDGNCIALAYEDGIWGCKLLEIDHNSNQIIGSHSYQILPSNYSNALFYNKVKNQIYLLSDYSVTIINPSNFSVVETIYLSETIRECQYSPRNDRLIIVFLEPIIQFYNASTYEFLHEIQFPVEDHIIATYYNQVNDMVYLHMFHYDINYYKNQIRLYSYRCDDFELSSDIYLQENFVKDLFPISPTEKMVFDESSNYLYIPNQGLGNISIVQCSKDEIALQPRVWNWLSFPRLEREDNNPVPAQNVLLNIDPFPPYLQMTNLPPQSYEEENIEYHTWTPHWTGDLNEIYSTRGYKLETSNTYVSYLSMEGTQLDPAYPLTIYAGYQNWVGYYPTWQQDPFAALADVLDELTLIKHHDWVCVKVWGYIPPRGNLEPYWICCNTKPLKYADMLILECSEDVTFQWGGASSGGNHELPKSDYYSYTEEPDYTPIFIELDTSDHPLEIGAFIADSCIGAAVVEELDSMVMIRGYMPDDSSGIVTFEKYYGAEKSASDRIDEYYVLNNTTNVREKRAINSRENKKYYLVSFKNEINSISWINPLILDLNPNPCPGSCKIDYFIPWESDVTFEVFDVYGRKLNTFLTENEQAGNYSIQWGKLFLDTSTPGIYLIRMSACGNAITKKAIITK